MNQTIVESFMRHVLKTPTCWLWRGPKNVDGYGWYKRVGAHRAAYIMLVRPIPPLALARKFHVCHICDVPACVNPDHLFLAPSAANTLDAIQKGRVGGMNMRLSENDVTTIRETYASGGITMAALAERFGVGQPTISRIISGKRRRVPHQHQINPAHARHSTG